MDTNATKGGWGTERSRYRGAAHGLVVWHPECCRSLALSILGAWLLTLGRVCRCSCGRYPV